MVKMGLGTRYARKYVKATQEEMRKTIIPQCADYCAKKRAELGWTPSQYRACLRSCIITFIKTGALPILTL